MPTFEIEDSVSGRKMVIEGDAPPTEADAAELFASIGDSSPVLNQHKTIGQRLGFGAPVPEGVDPEIWKAFGSDKAIQPNSVAGFAQEFMNPNNMANPLNYLDEIPKAAQYAMQGVDKGAAALGNMLFDRAHGLPNKLLQAVGLTGFPTEQMVFGSPEYAEGKATPIPKVFQAGKPIVDVRLPNADIDPVARAIGDIASVLTTPGNVATLPLVPNKAVQGLFASQTIPAAAQATAQSAMAPTTDEALEQGVHAIVNAAFSAGLTQGMNKGPAKQGVRASMEEFTPNDLYEIGGLVPPERRLVGGSKFALPGADNAALENAPRMANAAPELPLESKMIIGEGQHSGIGEAMPQIELKSSKVEPLNPGGSQASLSPELQALSKKNNSREAFEALQREADAKKRQEGKLYNFPLFDPEFWESQVGFAKQAKVDAQQLYNRLRNKTGEKSAQWEMIKDILPQSGKLTVEEAQKLIEERGPKIEIHSYGMEGKVSKERQEYDQMTHEWFDNLELSDQSRLQQFIANDYTVDEAMIRLQRTGATEKFTDMSARYLELAQKVKAEPRDTAPRATSAYSHVSPKDVKKFPVQRVDVVLPNKQKEWASDQTGKVERGVQWEPDGLHEQLSNTLGWAAIQYETLPSGEKVAHLFEVQSRWGQEVRNMKPKQGREGTVDDPSAWGVKTPDHPLLRDYNRLILKAAIEQARKEGATWIVISDAETAMMSEGHDMQHETTLPHSKHNTELAQKLLDNAPKDEKTFLNNVLGGFVQGRELSHAYWDWAEGQGFEIVKKPSQDSGMRLNYDTILPRIAEELTGSKGERMEMGEHKNAVEQIPISERRPMSSNYQETRPRSNLIFRNPDGTPKTTVSGLSYPLAKAREQFTMTGKDKALIEGQGKLYLNPIGPVLKQAAKDVGELTKKIHAKLASAKGAALTDFEMTSSAGHPTLRFRDYNTEKKIATTPQGIGRWYGFGPALDPRATAREPVMQAILTGQSMRHKAQQIATLYHEETKVQPRSFLADKQGQVELANGQKGYMSDVIEAEIAKPGSQPLTPEQKKFVADWKVIRQNLVDYARAEGVKKFVDEDGNVYDLNENYFPRPAYGKQGVEATVSATAGGPGSRQFFQKGRQFPTEQAGATANKGIKYEPDGFVRISKFMEGVYKAVADERLSNDPALQGRPAGTGAAKFLEEGGVHIPLGKGKIFPKDVADQINKYYGSQPHSTAKVMGNINDFLKAVQFTADASAPFNQGLLLMGRNPVAWAKATARSYATFADPKQLSKYLANPENQKAAREFVENGGSIGSLQDFLQGAQRGSIATRIPVVRHVVGRSASSMNAFLSVGKLELYKSLKDTVAPKELAKLVEDVENTMLSGRMESIGITPGRALAERLAFNAPSYMRAAANVIATAAQGKDGWKTAGRSLTQLAGGLSMMMYAAYVGSDMSDEEIAKRMDPRQSKFLKYPIKLRNGDVVEMGVGNIVLQIVKLGGQAADVATGNKEVNPGIQGDPFLRFASYRTSPIIQLGQQIYSGEDAFGREMTKASALGRAITPITAQEGLGKEKTGTKAALAVGTFAGLQTNPESYSAAKVRLQDETAMEKYGKKYNQLNATQRSTLTEGIESNLKTKKENMGVKGIEYAVKLAKERQEKLQSSLSTNAQSFLSRNGLRAPGVDTVLESRGTTASLSPMEVEALQAEVVKQYEKQIALMDKPWFARLSVADKKRFFESYMTQARTVARNKIRAGLGRNQGTAAKE